MATFI